MERNGIDIAHAEQVIAATAAPADVASALGIPEIAPPLRSERVVSDSQGRRVQHTVVLYRPEIYSYRVSMRRVGPGANRRWAR